MCVWSGRDPASGRLKTEQTILTGPCLRPVMDHRTRPVVIPEELDLSGIDRTLGGSVRSLPPERPVSRSCAALGLLFRFLSCRVGGPIYSIDRTLLAYSATDLTRALAAAAILSSPRASRSNVVVQLHAPPPTAAARCHRPPLLRVLASRARHRASSRAQATARHHVRRSAVP